MHLLFWTEQRSLSDQMGIGDERSNLILGSIPFEITGSASAVRRYPPLRTELIPGDTEPLTSIEVSTGEMLGPPQWGVVTG